MNLWSLITGPVFKYIAVSAIVLLGASLVTIKYLWSQNTELQKQVANLTENNERLRGYNKASEDARVMTEEQCEAKLEALRNRPPEEIDPNAEVDDNMLDRIRRSGLRDNKGDRATGSTGKGAGSRPASPKSP